MALHTDYTDLESYVTKDGSEIRELMHPALHGNRRQSLAEARVPPGGETALHLHRLTEELYHFIAGHGEMVLGEERLAVGPGATVAIPPGTPHRVINRGEEALVILCCCSPPYSHDDTELLPIGA